MKDGAQGVQRDVEEIGQTGTGPAELDQRLGQASGEQLQGQAEHRLHQNIEHQPAEGVAADAQQMQQPGVHQHNYRHNAQNERRDYTAAQDGNQGVLFHPAPPYSESCSSPQAPPGTVRPKCS